MLQNYLKTAWRHITSNKMFSVINILGLALGIAVFILIFQYVRFETSYDTFQDNGENIYRVQVDRYHNGELEYKNAYTVPALGSTIQSQVPGVKDYFRLTAWAESHTIIYQENEETEPVTFKEEKTIFADPAFVDNFSLDLIQAESDDLLSMPGSVLISEPVAERYFGLDWRQKNPVGETLLVYNSNRDNETTFTVAGVFKKMPQNSHLDYDIIFSHSSLPNFLPREIPEEQRLSMFETAWGPYAWYTYLVLNNQANPNEIARKVTALVEERNQAEQTSEVFHLQPIQDIHLYSNLMNEPTENANATWVFALLIVAICVLCLAWVNYINISTAKAVDRAKEVGLRKVMGAGKDQLVGQFLMETALVNAVAFLFSSALVQIINPFFNQWAGLPTDLFLLNTLNGWAILFGVYVIGTVCTGFYPAFILTSFKSSITVRGKAMMGAWGNGLRKGLVVFQFAASLALISSTAIVYQQIDYMQDEDLGIHTSQVMIIEGVNVLDQQTTFAQTVQNLRNEVISDRSIQEVSAVSQVPGEVDGLSRMVSRIGMQDEVGIKEIKEIGVDPEYFDVMGIEFLAGRGFSSAADQNQQKVILNESSLGLLDFGSPQEAIGSKIGIENHWGTTEYEVSGVIRNYHQRSLQYSIEPLLFFNEMTGGQYVIKLSSSGSSSVNETIQYLEARWKDVLPGNPFNYFFLDNHFARQYETDRRFGELMGLFALVAVFIACLGLFGLAAFSAERRTKEIGIRKVLGATVFNIVGLMSKQFLKLVALGFIIAIPIAWYSMSNWLQDFAYRIEINPLIFVVAGGVTILIALITVSWQSLKAALMNPVNSLRSE